MICPDGADILHCIVVSELYLIGYGGTQSGPAQSGQPKCDLSPEPLHLLLQQRGVGAAGLGRAGRGLLVDGLAGEGLGEGEGALLHAAARHGLGVGLVTAQAQQRLT